MDNVTTHHLVLHHPDHYAEELIDAFNASPEFHDVSAISLDFFTATFYGTPDMLIANATTISAGIEVYSLLN